MFTSVRLRGFRSFDNSGPLPLSAITVVIGKNNTGKSTLLRAVYQVQEGAPWSDDDVRLGHAEAEVELDFDRLSLPLFDSTGVADNQVPGKVTLTRMPRGQVSAYITGPDGSERKFTLAPSVEPGNLIYPSLSGRRTPSPEEQVRREATLSISPIEHNLVSRASVVMSRRTPDGREFEDLCRRVLGDTLDLMTATNGQRLGRAINRQQSIGLDAMGTGVGGVIGLLINLSGAHNKLFLVEEPENDLHPTALKALLDVMVEKSVDNQFLVSTHNGIVLTRLGAANGATVLKTATSDDEQSGIPTTTITRIDGREGRLEVLRDLGYALADMALGEGWLIFEESSAERLCRQFLIPWFAPNVARLNTAAADGTTRVGPLLQNLHEMTLYARLEPAYGQRLWVIADGDETGRDAIATLAGQFSTWPQGRFSTWDQPNFEEFYPEPFVGRAQGILSLSHADKRVAKRTLLNALIDWIIEDQARAREAFSKSAAGVIAILCRIEREVLASLEPADQFNA